MTDAVETKTTETTTEAKVYPEVMQSGLAAEFMGFKAKATLMHAVKAGKLVGRQIGKRWFFAKEALEAYKAAKPTEEATRVSKFVPPEGYMLASAVAKKIGINKKVLAQVTKANALIGSVLNGKKLYIDEKALVTYIKAKV